jgi:hypothetical protein
MTVHTFNEHYKQLTLPLTKLLCYPVRLGRMAHNQTIRILITKHRHNVSLQQPFQLAHLNPLYALKQLRYRAQPHALKQTTHRVGGHATHRLQVIDQQKHQTILSRLQQLGIKTALPIQMVAEDFARCLVGLGQVATLVQLKFQRG